MESKERLNIWKLGVELAKDVYILTEKFPKKEVYSLTDQIRRTVVSVPSNIAEGRVGTHGEGFDNFLSVARGSYMNWQPPACMCEGDLDT